MGGDRRRVASNVLLLVGYPLSTVAGAKLLPVLRERRLGRFLVTEAGVAAVTVGLVLRRRWLPAAVNGLAFTGLGVAWFASGRWLR
jgi:hypothetical protein